MTSAGPSRVRSGSSSSSASSSSVSSSSASSSSSSGSTSQSHRQRRARSSSTLSSSSSSDERPPASPRLVAAYTALMNAHVPSEDIARVKAADDNGSASTSAPSAVITAPDPTDDNDDDGAAANAAAEAALGRPLTKAEKQNAKKKRRKERERAARAELEAVRAAAEPEVPVEDDKPIDFPLFGPVRPVSLSTVEHYATTPNPRLAPLPAATRERIARIAADAAGGALAPPLSLLRDPEAGLDHYILLEGQARAHTTKEGTLPAMFVAVPSAGVGSAAKCVAAPKIKLVPREEVEAEADAEGYTEGTRRKRRRRPYREFPAPAFWQPAEGEEDRSAGYFYGWSV